MQTSFNTRTTPIGSVIPQVIAQLVENNKPYFMTAFALVMNESINETIDMLDTIAFANVEKYFDSYHFDQETLIDALACLLSNYISFVYCQY